MAAPFESQVNTEVPQLVQIVDRWVPFPPVERMYWLVALNIGSETMLKIAASPSRKTGPLP